MTTKKYSLPRDFATKWVAALRSGEYKQGKEILRDKENRFCCLGVAGRLCGADDNMLDWGFLKISDSALSEAVASKLPSLLIGRNDNSFVKEVSEMNDTGHTFHQIADWIEENVEFV